VDILVQHVPFPRCRGVEKSLTRSDMTLETVQPAGPLGHYSLSKPSSHISFLRVCSDCRSVVTDCWSGSEGESVPSTSVRKALQRFFLGTRILASTPSRQVSYQVL